MLKASENENIGHDVSCLYKTIYAIYLNKKQPSEGGHRWGKEGKYNGIPLFRHSHIPYLCRSERLILAQSCAKEKGYNS